MELKDHITKLLAFIIILLLIANFNFLWDIDHAGSDGYESSVHMDDHCPDKNPVPSPFSTTSQKDTRAVRNYLEDLNAQYNWIDISQTGTSIFLSDDDYEQVNMGLTFNFYDTPFTSCFICSNGMIVFTNTSRPREFENERFPSNVFTYFIAPLWDDLYPPEGGSIYYKKLTNPDRFVVSYQGIHHID
ncbi:MAG: hypothetical protein QGH40_14515, partial [bacterium]|nr:hypothetical protein [bacterium]